MFVQKICSFNIDEIDGRYKMRIRWWMGYNKSPLIVCCSLQNIKKSECIETSKEWKRQRTNTDEKRQKNKSYRSCAKIKFEEK